MKPRNKVTVSSTMLATYILSETRFGVYQKKIKKIRLKNIFFQFVKF